MRLFGAASVSIFLMLLALSLCAYGQESSLDGQLASATDLEVPAGAVPLRLQRQAVTNQTRRGALGTRWRHNWESRLSRADDKVQIEEWTGVISFTQAGKTLEYQNPSGERVTFTEDGRAVRRTLTGGLETFDREGRLVERTYRPASKQASKVLLRYDAQGMLSRVEGSGESFLLFSVDSAGRVIRVEGSTGAAVRYAYDKDDLTETRVNGGAPLRYRYDAKGALTRIEDPQSGALDIAYDGKGRPTSYRWADGSEQRLGYDDLTNIKRVIAADGGATVTLENPEKRRTEVTDPLGHKTVIQLDEAGRSVNITGPTGASSRLKYDSSGRILTSEDALGRATRYEYAGDSSVVKAIIPADGTRQEFEYDGDNNLAAIKIGGKIVSALTYNPDGSIASAKAPGTKEQKFVYHPNGLVKSVANALGETTQFEYDARGNLVRETNPLGGVIVRGYDPQARLITLTTPTGETTRYEYDSGGRLVREIDPAGGVTRFAYDKRGRLIAETDPADQVTRYEYTPINKIATVVRPGNRTESNSYDLAGNLTARTDHLGRTTKLEYDPAGRLVREQLPAGLEVLYRYDAAGNLIASEDSAGSKSAYQVDAFGQTTARTDPDGGKTQFQYDPLGNLLAVTDALGRVKRYGHTADGDLAQVGEPSRDEAKYEYDAAGRIVAVLRPSGGAVRFTYDPMGNLLTITDPLGNVKRYGYDNAGRLLSLTDAAGRVTRHVYDKAGRRTEKQLPDGKRVTYKYDAIGRMIEADDGVFPVRMSYDKAGNLKKVEYAAIKKTVAYEYDAQGLRTKMTAPDGRETRYEYNQLKQLSAVALPDGKKITLSYDEKNRQQSVAYPNGITGRWTYDANGQVARIAYTDKSGKAAGTSYRYDLAGNPVERRDAQGQMSRFTYDPAGQLIEETNNAGSTKYRYAAGGNRAAVEEGAAVRQYKHDAADRLIEAGTERLAYDADGNLINRKGADGSSVYEYDVENRLVKVAMPDGATTTFGYAPTGERAWRRDKNGITYFLYDGLNLSAELGDDLRTKTSFVHGFGIDRPLAMLQDKQSYYYLSDRVGSITHLTDNNGKVASAYTYDAFGRIKAKQGTIANPFAYTGRELDPTGLYYYRARYYDAALGRFLSSDLVPAQLDEPLDQNPYLYVRNNPVSLVDPLGLDSFSPEYLGGQSDDSLIDLFKASRGNPSAQEQVYRVMRSRGMGTPQGDKWFFARPVRQPDGTLKGLAWDPGSPPALENAPPPESKAGGRVVGRPGQAGPANPNPGVTGDAPAPGNNPSGANRAGSNADAVRPQPGAPRGNTVQVGDARPGGNTLVGAPTTGSGNSFWTLNPNAIRPGITGTGTAASIIAAIADCQRRGLSNCGPSIAIGLGIGGIATAVVGKAVAGPVGTLIAGGKSWWEIDKELNKGWTDQAQRDQQAKDREAQAQANLKNREAFYARIELLRGKINALKKDHDTITQNLPKAQEQATIARSAAIAAEKSLGVLREKKANKQQLVEALCGTINANPPATLKTEIDALAARAEDKQRESDRILSEARQFAANCASVGDAQAVRERYARIKPLLGQIDLFKSQAEQKKAALDNVRQKVEDFKAQDPANVTTDVADKWLEADTAAKEATRLVTQIRDSIAVLDPGEKQLRREINALQGAAPEALLADIQDRINELHGLLSSLTKYPALVRYDDQAVDDARSAGVYKDEAVRILEGWKVAFPCQIDIPSVDAAIQRPETARTMTGANIAAAADLLNDAKVCEASANCIPVINQTRQLLEQLQIEAGEAGINQARQQGCHVAGLETALDYYRTIRDAVALLFNAKEQCKFQEGLAFAQKMPASMQNNPWIANAIGELRDGLAAQTQLESLITKATTAAGSGNSLVLGYDYAESRKLFAEADGYLAQADQLAAPRSCLVERLNRFRAEYERLKVSANNISGGQGATTTANDTQPLPGNTPPTGDVPSALGDGGFWDRTKSLAAGASTAAGVSAPTADVPSALGDGGFWDRTKSLAAGASTAAGVSTPTDEVPVALGGPTGVLGAPRPPFNPPGETNPGSQGSQAPSDEVPGATGSNTGRPPVGDGPGQQPGGTKEGKPGDSTPWITAEQIGAVIGAIGGIVSEIRKQKPPKGGGSGGTTGGGSTGQGGAGGTTGAGSTGSGTSSAGGTTGAGSTGGGTSGAGGTGCDPFVGTWHGLSRYSTRDVPSDIIISKDVERTAECLILNQGHEFPYPATSDGTKLSHQFGIYEISWIRVGDTLQGSWRYTDVRGGSHSGQDTLRRK